MTMVGGIQEEKKADKEIIDIIEQIKQNLYERIGTVNVKPISYKKQLVNGINYFVKVSTEDGYNHLRIYKPFNSAPSLITIQQGKTKDEKIEYF